MHITKLNAELKTTVNKIVQQVVGHLPWGHNRILLSKLKNSHERLRTDIDAIAAEIEG